MPEGRPFPVNLSFLDGHAEFHRWQAAKAKTFAAVAVEDLPDLRWLQARLPEP